MQTSSSVLRAWLLLILLILVTPGITAEQKRPEAAPPAKPPKAQAPAPNKRVPNRSSNFTPSEKIKADSSVSFPVDI